MGGDRQATVLVEEPHNAVDGQRGRQAERLGLECHAGHGLDFRRDAREAAGLLQRLDVAVHGVARKLLADLDARIREDGLAVRHPEALVLDVNLFDVGGARGEAEEQDGKDRQAGHRPEYHASSPPATG